MSDCIEKRQPVHAYMVKAFCPTPEEKYGGIACEGELVPDGQILLSNPPKFPHKCERCGATINLSERYPLIRYEAMV